LMKVETMLNHPNSWPAQDHLYIDGLEYNRIDETAFLNVKSQLDWLRLQPKHTLFVQPYEQLANVMRTMGGGSVFLSISFASFKTSQH
jgi:hypothetical protein